MSRNKCVKKVGELDVAVSLVYGNYKNVPHLNKTIKAVAKAIPVLRKLCNVNSKLTFTLRPIKGRNQGVFWHGGNGHIEIDPRRGSLFAVISTLAHEFVHAEQQHSGRLKECGGGVFLWENNTAISARTTSYERYRALPWEAEAFARQDGLAVKVMEALGLPMDA